MKNKNLDRWLIALTIVCIFNSIVSVWAIAVISIHGGAIYKIKEYSINNFEWIEKLNTKILKLESGKNQKDYLKELLIEKDNLLLKLHQTQKEIDNFNKSEIATFNYKGQWEK